MTTQHELETELNDLAQAELDRESEPAPALSSVAVHKFPRDERNAAVAVHLGTMGLTVASGALFLPTVVPFIAHLLARSKSASLQDHVRQQLNFQLTLAIVAVAGVALSVITLGIGLIAFIPTMIFLIGVELFASIKGALAASRGENYAFPFTLDLVS